MSGKHEELVLPAQTLRAATINGATFMGVASRSGSITEGKDADLVLLTANSLADIRNVRSIAAVVARGKVYGRADLDRLLQAIKNK
jgi:imidazolonepropionase-like amidohydrolase